MFWGKWIVAVSLLCSGPSIDEVLGGSERLGPAKRAIDRLQSRSATPLAVEWNPAAGTPSLLAGSLTEPSYHTPQWIAIEFLKRVKPLYGLKRVEEQMAVVRVERDQPDYTKVVLQRRLYGKPVCGDELTIEVDHAGVVTRASGTIHADLEKKRLNRPMVPAVTERQAAIVASRYLKGRYPVATADVQACYLPDRESVPLVYKVTFSFAADGEVSPSVHVHGLTGLVIE